MTWLEFGALFVGPALVRLLADHASDLAHRLAAAPLLTGYRPPAAKTKRRQHV